MVGFASFYGIILGAYVQELAALMYGGNHSAELHLASHQPQPPAHRNFFATSAFRGVGRRADYVRRIPLQLIFTWKGSTMDQLPPPLLQNVQRTIAMNSDLQVRWLGDAECRGYLQSYYDQELVQFFTQEKLGMYRGDICRAAVLAKEGGFYVDLDFQLNEPLTTLVENDTTFMSAFGHYDWDHGILNALMGATPDNPIVKESIEQIRQRYRAGPKENMPLLGPTSLRTAMVKFAKQICSSSQVVSEATLRWECGPEVLKMYQERHLACFEEYGDIDPACPAARRLAIQQAPETAYVIYSADHSVVGWPRFAGCTGYGCGGGGHQPDEHP